MNEYAKTHRASWDGYWRDLATTVGEAAWDSDAALVSGPELPYYADAMDRSLPLIDFGCGNGRLARYLADHFPRIIGVDVSAEVIRGARQINASPNVEYRVLDALDPSQGQALHAEIGDANVHVHGLFHQFAAEHRPVAARTMAAITGQRGLAFIVEVTSATEEYFKKVLGPDQPPQPKLTRILDHGIQFGTLGEEEMPALLGPLGFRVLRQGTVPFPSTCPAPEGGVLTFPMHFWLFERAR